MSERIALYAGTRNLYHDMVVACKSLIYHDGADRVIFLIEDDTFPEKLPPCVTTVNVVDQTIFPRTGPNYTCRWTYMALMRCGLTKLFPDIDRILTLDVDTIVNKRIDFLWDLDMTDYYFAAVEENQIVHRIHPYFNFGVVMHNLAKLRSDGTDDVIIRSINSSWFAYPEQDAMNSVCRHYTYSLPQEFNAMWFNKPQLPPSEARIIHYANTAEPFCKKPYYASYENAPWDTIISQRHCVGGGME